MLKVLITYASAHGTTQSVAERIESRIKVANIGSVTVQPIDKNPHPSDFDVLIIGSAIHVGSWLSPASRFVKINKLFLQEQPRPTWAFSVGMPPKGKREQAEEESLGKWLRGLVELRGHKLFQGRYQKGDFPWPLSWVFSCFGGKIEDRREWDVIEKWADDIVHELRTNPPKLVARRW